MHKNAIYYSSYENTYLHVRSVDASGEKGRTGSEKAVLKTGNDIC